MRIKEDLRETDITVVKRDILYQFTCNDRSEISTEQRNNTCDAENSNSVTDSNESCEVNVKKLKSKEICPLSTCSDSKRSPRQVIRNERERGRKARLNAGFRVLRTMIPGYCGSPKKDKLTQVQVLKMAAKYIYNLTVMLEENDNRLMSRNVSEEYNLFCQLYSMGCIK